MRLSGLLQQYRPKAAVSRCSKNPISKPAYSITSSARSSMSREIGSSIFLAEIEHLLDYERDTLLERPRPPIRSSEARIVG